jgi:uncharacterized protein
MSAALATAVAAALATGLAGSLHCSLMCGPLAASGCARARDGAAYVAGRFASYAAVGALVGAFGRHALCALPMETLNRATLVFVVGFAAWKAFTALRARRPPLVPLRRRSLAPDGRRAWWPRRGLGLGLATGLLPCSMLLPAWALAMGAGGAWQGAAVMVVFAAASLPGLLAPLLASTLLRRRLPSLSPAAQGLVWAALGVWIAVRPLLMSGHVHH